MRRRLWHLSLMMMMRLVTPRIFIVMAYILYVEDERSQDEEEMDIL